jgi:DNA-binding GntR family transcriptional regulator
MLELLKPQPALIDQVHDRLVAAIVSGRLAPGQKLTQESVAEMLGVSRQPVSHALQLLKHRGLLIEHDKRSLAVAPMDGTMVRDLYQVREPLEALAASLAAGRVRDNAASSRERSELEAALTAGETLPADTDLAKLVAADVAFHTALHHLSGNPQIATTVAEQWPHFMRSMSLVLTTTDRRERIWTEHRGIAEAVLDGDPDEAERRARAHTAKAAIDTARRLNELANVA